MDFVPPFFNNSVWKGVFCEQTEKGQKYLKNAYLMTQKKPDIKRLKEVFG